MRIAAWNCQQALGLKIGALCRLSPDVAVISEAARPGLIDSSPLVESAHWHWQGRLPAKGLAIAGFGTPIAPIPSPSGNLTVCAAAEAHGIGVLGVWAVPGRWPYGGDVLPDRSYADEIRLMLEAHADWIATGRVIVAGDFNLIINALRPGSTAERRVRRLLETIDHLGLISAYHAWTGEPLGAETAMTHFHLRRRERGFHIDYVLIPRRWTPSISRVWVGSPRPWLSLSDHMPLVVDLDLTDTGQAHD